jgi:hypothetical protein
MSISRGNNYIFVLEELYHQGAFDIIRATITETLDATDPKDYDFSCTLFPTRASLQLACIELED